LTQFNRAPQLSTAVGPTTPELVGSSAVIGRVRDAIGRAALAGRGVLFVAQAGTDVESVARELHALSRPGFPFVVVHCAAEGVDRLLFGESDPLAPPDLESVSADCRIAAARGGTVFLQNIGDLPAGVQARLARIARDGEVWIDREPVATAIRLVASASADVEADVQEHRVRSDLYRRLATSRIDLPPFSVRRGDVPAIATRLLEDRCGAMRIPARAFADAALALLAALTWPGNLAELREVVVRAAENGTDGLIEIEHLLPILRLDRAPAPFRPAGELREARLRFERDYIAAVLEHHGWQMAAAAQTLGIQRPNLYRKARQLGIPLTRVSD
jgi:DNA-binding NtrC family response regulator